MVSVKHFVVAALIAAAAACAPTTAPPASDAVQEQVAELWTAETRTVLTGDATHLLVDQCSRPSPGPVEGVWRPSHADLELLEDELILLVAREQEARGESPSPGDYYRQYAGYVIGGRRIIYVNGVAESAIRGDSSWRTEAILICDGGPITFGVEYDPATRQFSNFAFNGSV